MQTYEERLAEALATYRRVAGREVPAERLDRGDPEVLRLYRAFVRPAERIDLGSNDAEWASLRLGMKPMVREVLAPDQWAAVVPQLEQEGYQTLALHIAVSEEPYDGFTFERGRRLTGGGEDAWVTRVSPGGAGEDRLIVYAGHDRDRLAQARDVDRRLVAERENVPETELVARMGGLLGYPACCTAAYVGAGRKVWSNHRLVSASLFRTGTPRPLLNNLSLGMFHYIGWFPCRYDCPASLEWAGRIDAHYAAAAPGARAAALRALSLPRVYLDDRRQLLLDGAVQPDGSVRFRTVLTPFAHDRGGRSPDTAAFDWVFFVDVAAPLLGGGVLRHAGRQITLERDGAARQLDLPDTALWFPFQG